MALVVALASLTAASVAFGGGQRSAGAATVTAHASRFGKVLFDGSGRALYLFKRDRGSRSTCSGACAKAWPQFLTTSRPKAAAGARASLLGTTKRTDGTVQVHLRRAHALLLQRRQHDRPDQVPERRQLRRPVARRLAGRPVK